MLAVLLSFEPARRQKTESDIMSSFGGRSFPCFQACWLITRGVVSLLLGLGSTVALGVDGANAGAARIV